MEEHLAYAGTKMAYYCYAYFSNNINWYFNGKSLPEDVKLDKKNKSSLTIEKVSKHHQGVYECIGNLNKSPYYPMFAAQSFLLVDGKKLCNGMQAK